MRGKNRGIAEVIIFSIITCGIYYLYWLYKFAEELKFYLGDDSINPGLDLVLCIVCAPYAIYWFYKYGKLLSEAQRRVGLPTEDNSVLFIVLSIFGFAIINTAIMQSTANKIWDLA